MKEEINFNGFTDAFRTYFNGQYKNNFSYDGLKVLYDYLEGYEENCETEIGLDVIALCCEYSEYKDIDEYLKEYHPSEITTFEEWKEQNELHKDYNEQDEYIKDISEKLEEYLNNNTTLIKLSDNLDDGFIIQCF